MAYSGSQSSYVCVYIYIYIYIYIYEGVGLPKSAGLMAMIV